MAQILSLLFVFLTHTSLSHVAKSGSQTAEWAIFSRQGQPCGGPWLLLTSQIISCAILNVGVLWFKD